MSRQKLNFPAATSEALAHCFTSFYNAFPDARNIRVVNFGENEIEISWDDEKPEQEESK